jgi:hypothetical protein
MKFLERFRILNPDQRVAKLETYESLGMGNSEDISRREPDLEEKKWDLKLAIRNAELELQQAVVYEFTQVGKDQNGTNRVNH